MKKFQFIFPALVITVLLFNSCQKDARWSKGNIEATTVTKSGAIIEKPNLSLPDLTIDEARLQSSAVVKTAVFKSTDCAIVEGMINSTGKHKLLRFDVATPNIGTADMFLGDPTTNPVDANGHPLFIYSPCHRHYHFNGYALYELLNASDVPILTGRKQAFCLEDFAKYFTNPGPSKYTCSYQGITVGWQDIYTSNLDGQWLDVTTILPGTYKLHVTINPDKSLTESNYDNNTATVPVTISK